VKLQLIRNATLKLDYAGRTVLIDPYFAPKYSQPTFAGRSANPLVELPLDIDDILDGVELVIVSHLHEDHFDSVAAEHVPKHLPIFCQPGDEGEIREAGFTDVTELTDRARWEGLMLTRREGSHGLGSVIDEMGSVMGFSLEARGEPSIYWAGDTVLYPPVADVIHKTKPDIVITHSCGARWDGDLHRHGCRGNDCSVRNFKHVGRDCHPYGGARSRDDQPAGSASRRRGARHFCVKTSDTGGWRCSGAGSNLLNRAIPADFVAVKSFGRALAWLLCEFLKPVSWQRLPLPWGIIICAEKGLSQIF
jgi:L-ascorbate metabolism protein UlaG (beta-lactamase superfamily)